VTAVANKRGTQARKFAGLTHEQLLALDLTPSPQLVDGLIEAGTPGTIAGLPETYKSWLSTQLAFAITTGGRVLGRDVLTHGPVGYWWQDDSRENEARRIKAYANTHNYLDGDLPIRWHLNEGLALPADVAVLRAEVEDAEQVLVVLDSLYNFLPGLKLKDEDVATVLATLKADVCDPTGCALLFIDHSPWPTDSNRGQRRGYGSVFKAAAIRWGIYLDRSNDTIFVEGRGNNIAGLSRTAAMWDVERLELRLVEPPSQTDELADRIGDFLGRNPGAATSVVVAGVTGNDKQIRKRLESDERFKTVPPVLFGKPKNTKCWARSEDVPDLLREHE
jgi:AAA domain